MPKPNPLTKSMSRVAVVVGDAIGNPFDAFYDLRKVDTAGEKRLSFANIWTHIKSNYLKENMKQAYLSANLDRSDVDDRFELSDEKKVSFSSVVSPIKLLNPFRHLYSLISLVGIGIVKAVDTIVPRGKRTSPAAVAVKSLLLAPFALANNIVEFIASIDEPNVTMKPKQEPLTESAKIRLEAAPKEPPKETLKETPKEMPKSTISMILNTSFNKNLQSFWMFFQPKSTQVSQAKEHDQKPSNKLRS